MKAAEEKRRVRTVIGKNEREQVEGVGEKGGVQETKECHTVNK